MAGKRKWSGHSWYGQGLHQCYQCCVEGIVVGGACCSEKKKHLGSIILLPNSLLPLPHRQIHPQEITSERPVFLGTYLSSTHTELVREVLKHGINCRSFLMEAVSRSYYAAISLRGWRHPAARQVWTAICWLCVPLYKEAVAPFLLMTWGWWFFSLLFCELGKPLPVQAAPTGAVLSADDVPIACAVQYWMTHGHLCQAFIFSAFCPTHMSLGCVSLFPLDQCFCWSDTQSIVPDPSVASVFLTLLERPQEATETMISHIFRWILMGFGFNFIY